MFCYTAYNLVIHSELRLPELEAVEQSPPDVVIRRRRLSQPALLEADGGDCFAGTVSTIATALVERGCRITIDPAQGVEEGITRTSVLGPLLSILLRQRGLLPLHASSVVLRGGAVAFVGPSGWGKSTLAQAFYAQGHSLIADDVTAVDLKAVPPVVVPAYPQLKLLPDAVASLVDEAEHLPRLHSRTSKQVHRAVRRFPKQPVPLHKVYVLEAGEAHEIVPLDAQAAFRVLARHTRAGTLLTTQKYVEQLFQQCALLAQQVPVARLKRARSLAALPEVVRLVAEDLEADAYG